MRSRILLLALVAASGVSCSSGVRLHPVRGQVHFKGRPVEGAMVVLHPLVEPPEGVPKPIAISDQTGSFKLTTHKPGDGAPAGEYAVTVEQREKLNGREKHGGRNLLPARFSKPETSGLRCQVKEGENELPLDLPEK